MSPPPRLRVVGAGRAGTALATALGRAGWQVVGLLGRRDDATSAAQGVDLVVIATPDDAIASVADAVEPSGAVVAHLAGSLGLDVLGPHARRAAIHPLVSLPDAEVGARRLSGAWFAVAGDPIAQRVASDLGGRWFEVADEDRGAYHAAAAVASNHVVALMGQVERIAGAVGVPGEAYVQLAAGALANVASLGPTAALTGPVARGDWATVARHLEAIDPSERPAYLALAEAARRLVDGDGLPAHLLDRFGTSVDRCRQATTIDRSSQEGVGSIVGTGVVVHETIAGLRAALDTARQGGATVGFVPTMGYLHDGHASLMRAASAQCDVAVASIFVNPLQFAANEDLSSYPRDLDRDLEICADAGITYVLHPSVDEMYPGGPVLTTVSVAEITARFEGASRPTHFAGVATVVAKLFSIVGPCRAYFGEKDFQQLAVVRRMAADLSMPVDVVGCLIVREPDGLAMSSRNVYLTEAQRAAAPVLNRSLGAAAALAQRGGATVAEVVAVVADAIAAEPEAELDYVALVDAATLEPASTVVVGEQRLLAVARFGATRLLDNLAV